MSGARDHSDFSSENCQSPFSQKTDSMIIYARNQLKRMLRYMTVHTVLLLYGENLSKKKELC